MSVIAKKKEELRQLYVDQSCPAAGKLAQALRRTDIYRQSTVVYVDGAVALHQVRINCLLDGKQLCMPSPALKSGFFLFKPYTVPFKDLPYAVLLKGVEGHGTQLAEAEIASLGIDLALTDVVAVDEQGRRLGDGSGFFDLALGILAEYSGLTASCKTAGLVTAEQVCKEEIPMAAWDVVLDFAVSVNQEYSFAGSTEALKIYWDALAEKKIRKLDLLWKLAELRQLHHGS